MEQIETALSSASLVMFIVFFVLLFYVEKCVKSIIRACEETGNDEEIGKQLSGINRLFKFHYKVKWIIENRSSLAEYISGNCINMVTIAYYLMLISIGLMFVFYFLALLIQ